MPKKAIEAKTLNVKKGGKVEPFQTKLEQAAAMIIAIASHFAGVPVLVVSDSWFGNNGLFKPVREALGLQFHLLARLRVTSMLYGLPPERTPKQRGAKRKYGEKPGSVAKLAAQFRDRAQRYRVHLYGRSREVLAHQQVFMLTCTFCMMAVTLTWIYILTLLVAGTRGWALEPIGPASESVLQALHERGGVEPTAEDLVIGLDRLTVRTYQDGEYVLAETAAREALALGERELGEEQQQTLSALNNLASVIKSQGRYGEAEPLYVRALQASERMLAKHHPDALSLQLNLIVALINSEHRNKAVRELRRVDERLRRFVGVQLTTTLMERVRRRWLVSESNFQDILCSLALRHPQPDILRLAADVLLRWKRLAGESEAPTARLARSSRDLGILIRCGKRHA